MWMIGHQATTRTDYESGDVPPGLYEAAEAWGIDPKEYRGRTSEVRTAVIAAKRRLGAERGYHNYANMTDQQLVATISTARCSPT